MVTLTGNCKKDFETWALNKYGYTDIYYLGLPTVLEFFDQFLEWEMPRIKAIGEIRQRHLIQNIKNTIEACNKVYNSNYDEIKSTL